MCLNYLHSHRGPQRDKVHWTREHRVILCLLFYFFCFFVFVFKAVSFVGDEHELPPPFSLAVKRDQTLSRAAFSKGPCFQPIVSFTILHGPLQIRSRLRGRRRASRSSLQASVRAWTRLKNDSSSTSKHGPVCHTGSSLLKLMFWEAQKSRVNGMQLNSLHTSHSYTGTL